MSQLLCLNWLPSDADQSSIEAIADWHYWLAQGYCS
jgi:hypothetical protein